MVFSLFFTIYHKMLDLKSINCENNINEIKIGV